MRQGVPVSAGQVDLYSCVQRKLTLLHRLPNQVKSLGTLHFCRHKLSQFPDQVSTILFLNRVCLGSSSKEKPAALTTGHGQQSHTPAGFSRLQWRRRFRTGVSGLPAAPPRRLSRPGSAPTVSRPRPSPPRKAGMVTVAGSSQLPVAQHRRGTDRATALIHPAQPWTGRWPENSGIRSELQEVPQATGTRGPGGVGGGWTSPVLDALF